MNRKIILIGMALIVLALIVYAAPTPGTIITQQQLNDVNMETYDFEDIFISKNVSTNQLNVVWGVMTLDRERDETNMLTGNYVVTPHTHTFRFAKSKYLSCKMTYGKAYCQNQVKDHIDRSVLRLINTQRNRIKKWQTDENIDSELLEITFE